MLILPREQLEQRVTRNEDIQSFRCQRQTYRIVYRTVGSIDKRVMPMTAAPTYVTNWPVTDRLVASALSNCEEPPATRSSAASRLPCADIRDWLQSLSQSRNYYYV